MKKVLKFIQQNQLIEDGDHVIAGVSGGADSVCLLFLLKKFQKELGYTLSAVHVNHHLRGEEALRDERFTKELCDALEIPCEVYHYEVAHLAKEEKMSIEEAGRAARYEAFERQKAFIADQRAVKIALAHHQNDLAETMIYHLARGTDLAGLSSIRPKREAYIRPLLCMNRMEIEHYLEEHGIKYVTDSTNCENVYTRNKIRHHVVEFLEQEINGQTALHMAEASRTIGEVQDFLMEVTEEVFQRCATEALDGCIHLKGSLFDERPLLVRGVIRMALERLQGNLKNMGRVHVAQVISLWGSHVGKRIQLPYELCAEREYEGIVLYKGKQEAPGEQEPEESVILPVPGEIIFGDYLVKTGFVDNSLEKIQKKRYTKWFDYDKIGGNLVLRYRQKGDYLTVNAQGGHKKLKDYFINEKVPQKERDQIPLLCCGHHVVWVCGYRISEQYKVDETSKRIVEVQVSFIHKKQ